MTVPTVAVATRNRAGELDVCLARLSALPERPRVIVVDNGSVDDTVAVTERHGFEAIKVGHNLGAAARNIGAAYADGEYVAFCDDDAAWEPGSLAAAAALLDEFPNIALVAPAIFVEGKTLDPVCHAMETSPLGRHRGSDLPEILGFLACAVVVRRRAFLDAGGFAPWIFIGGEEELVAIDLARAGWHLCYDDRLLARHDPSRSRDARLRRHLELRNALWVRWARYRPVSAMRSTIEAVSTAIEGRRSGDLTAWRALVEAAKGAGPILCRRRVVSRGLALLLASLDT